MLLLENIDYIGSEAHLTIKGRKRYQTAFGGLLFLIILLLITAATFYYGLELFYKNNPIVLTGVSSAEDPPKVQLNPQNLPFALSVDDPTNYLNSYKDPSIFVVKAFLYHQFRSTDDNGNPKITASRTPINLTDCDPAYHFQGIENQFKLIDSKTSYGIAKDEEIFLKGDFVSQEWMMFQFYLYECRNTTESQTCKSKEEIDQKLKSAFASIEYGKLFYNPANYTTPISKARQEYYTSISNYDQTQNNIYIKHSTYTTDNGFLLTNKQSESHIEVDYVTQMLNNIVPGNNDYFASFNFRLSFTQEVNQRSYLKIQELLAYLGGLLKVLTMTASIFIEILTKNFYYLDLIKENYRISEVKENSSIKNKDHFKGQAHQSIDNLVINKVIVKNEIRNSIPIYNYMKKKNVNIDDGIEKIKNQQTLKFNTFEFLRYVICHKCLKKKKTKENLFEIGKEKVKEQLEVFALLKFYIELEKMKQIMLSENQMILFNKSPGLNLDLETDLKKQNKKISINTFKNSYQNLKNNISVEQNKKILELYGNEFHEIFAGEE